MMKINIENRHLNRHLIWDKKRNPLWERVFADWTGLEPATSAVTGRHSNQLNYQSIFLKNYTFLLLLNREDRHSDQLELPIQNLKELYCFPPSGLQI